MGPISPPPSPHSPQLGPQPTSSFPCHIMNGNLVAGMAGHWESCLIDQNGDWCTPVQVYGCTDCGTIWENDTLLNPGGLYCWEVVNGNVLNPWNHPNPTVSAGATNVFIGANIDDGSCVY